MSYLYAIHDAYYPGCNDGDVDDRAAIQYYNRFITQHAGRVVVYLVGEGRYETAKNYMEQTEQIEFKHEFNADEARGADKILLCAPIADEKVRAELAAILREEQNGYCQGDKIGVTNFPKPEYQELLESIPEKHRFSTQSTAITFPPEILDVLDPNNKDEYMSYGLLKLFAIGGIIHIPSLVYRLYCPKIGGGPGTNMLKIQELIQKHIIHKMIDCDSTKVQQLKELIVYDGNFEVFNSLLIDTIWHKEIYKNANMKMVDDFMMTFSQKMPDANFTAMENALRVMVFFARMIYVTHDARLLFDSDINHFYSLSQIPRGTLMIQLDETPPLYDFVVAFLALNEYTNLAYFLSDKELTRDKIMNWF